MERKKNQKRSRRVLLAQFGVLALTLAGPALGRVENCVTCGSTQNQGPLEQLTTQKVFELARPVEVLEEKNAVNWDGVGPLPNSFVRPWEMPYTKNFDPSFQIPSYLNWVIRTPLEHANFGSPYSWWVYDQSLQNLGMPVGLPWGSVL